MKRTPLYRHSRLRPVSAKRVKLNRIYSSLRKKFLEEHPYCQWFMAENGLGDESNVVVVVGRGPVAGRSIDGFRWCEWRVPKSEDVHHRKGRGKYLLDVSTWMAVSRKGHDWIHAHPKESYEKGYMLQR